MQCIVGFVDRELRERHGFFVSHIWYSFEDLVLGGLGSSEHKGEQGSPGPGVVLKPGHVVPVVVDGSGPDGADGEEGEGEGREGPGRHGKTDPLQDLPKEVGPRHELKHPPVWDPVDRLSWFPEAPQDVVAVDVDDHPEQEEEQTCSDASVRGPGGLEAGAVQQVVTLQEAVERAEDGGVEDDGERDGASSGQEAVDHAPVEVVQHEAAEQQSPPGLPGPSGPPGARLAPARLARLLPGLQ